MSANGDSGGMHIPVIELAECNVMVGRHPNNPQIKVLMIGPLVLCIPLDEEASKVVVKGLTGIHMATSIPKQP